MIKVPIILLNYNSSSDCAKCISYLKRQRGVEIEIVVVDNCSQADDLTRLRALCQNEPLCTLIENHENRGYNAGNNIGLRYAAEKGYKYALIANPDMEFPQEDYVAKLVAKMEEDESVVVCGSDIVGVDGKHQNPMKPDGDWKQSWKWLFSLFKPQCCDSYDFIDNYTHSHYCSKVSGCCLMVSMRFIEQVGFFDEKVFLYCEEAILAKQVKRAGKKLYYMVDVQALHRHIPSAKGDPAKRFRHWRDARIYFIKEYSGDTAFGKFMATISMRTYAAVFILKSRIKR